jgi:hypothetical protein
VELTLPSWALLGIGTFTTILGGENAVISALVSALNLLADGIALLSVFIQIAPIPAPASVRPLPELQVHLTPATPYKLGATVNLVVVARDKAGNQVHANVVAHTEDANGRMQVLVFGTNQPKSITLRCFKAMFREPQEPLGRGRSGPITRPRAISLAPDGYVWASAYAPTPLEFGVTEDECGFVP